MDRKEITQGNSLACPGEIVRQGNAADVFAEILGQFILFALAEDEEMFKMKNGVHVDVGGMKGDASFDLRTTFAGMVMVMVVGPSVKQRETDALSSSNCSTTGTFI